MRWSNELRLTQRNNHAHSPEKNRHDGSVPQDSSNTNDRYVDTYPDHEPVGYRIDDVTVARPVRMKINRIVVVVARQRIVAWQRYDDVERWRRWRRGCIERFGIVSRHSSGGFSVLTSRSDRIGVRNALTVPVTTSRPTCVSNSEPRIDDIGYKVASRAWPASWASAISVGLSRLMSLLRRCRRQHRCHRSVRIRLIWFQAKLYLRR